MDKSKCERKHAKRRARERYGLDINQEDRCRMVKDIQENKARLIERQSNSRSIFIVSVRGCPCKVVYDRQRHEIITFLPPDEAS